MKLTQLLDDSPSKTAYNVKFWLINIVSVFRNNHLNCQIPHSTQIPITELTQLWVHSILGLCSLESHFDLSCDVMTSDNELWLKFAAMHSGAYPPEIVGTTGRDCGVKVGERKQNRRDPTRDNVQYVNVAVLNGNSICQIMLF